MPVWGGQAADPVVDKWAIVLVSAVDCPAHTTAPVSAESRRTNQHLIASIYHPLSAPNRANTSGEFKPLTSQKSLCNNRLGFWRFNSILALWGRCEGVGRCRAPGAAKALSWLATCPMGPSWDTRPPV